MRYGKSGIFRQMQTFPDDTGSLSVHQDCRSPYNIKKLVVKVNAQSENSFTSQS